MRPATHHTFEKLERAQRRLCAVGKHAISPGADLSQSTGTATFQQISAAMPQQSTDQCMLKPVCYNMD